MNTITIEATWSSTHTVDVSDLDMDEDDLANIRWGNLSDWPEEVLEQVDTSTASLTDWDVRLR